MAEQRAGIQEKESSLALEEGAGNSGGLEGCGVCRWKIRRAKAQLELNLTAVKESKNYFYKYTSNKSRAKENLHPLLNTG